MFEKFKFLVLFHAIFLASCAATIPKIYLKQGDIKMELNKEAYSVEALAISRDGQYLLTGDIGANPFLPGTVRLWNLREGKQPLKMKSSGKKTQIISASVSPDNRYAITGSFTWESSPGKLFFTPPPLEIWDLTKGNLYKSYPRIKGFRGNAFNSVSFSSDGKHFLACDWTSIYIFDAKT
jgi:WD40 repeat protein